ncbi:amino acid permease [Peribacillus frigoritolerans]|uniref:amino acid permease n=1 Tax=Peribacillus frigoritolerans TaxID=450367 RepID=UPI003F8316B5
MEPQTKDNSFTGLQTTHIEKQLHRKLKGRHLSMIAIGGAIGTGLFFASGSAVSQAGPGGALLSYIILGILVYFVMTSLGEMATLIPSSGAFEDYANRFVDPAAGFAFGWSYWFGWAITLAAELIAGAFIVKFWFPDTSTTLWAVFFFIILLSLNLFSVKLYGETEYWLSGIKVATVIIFIITGILMITGMLNGHSVGFQNWTFDGQEAGKAPFVGGIFTMLSVFLVAGFSFLGTEIVGLAAGESEEPQKNIPKAINTVFWRILIFYIGTIAIIGFIVPFTDPRLLHGEIENIAASPFTLVFQNAGFNAAASLMNAVILTAVLSAGNSSLYTASRMLYAMGKSRSAPRIFTKIDKRGIPVYAVVATASVAGLSFLSSLIGDGKIYSIFYSASGISGFITWFGIALCHYRFRKAYIVQGRNLDDLKYKSKFYPFGPLFAMVLSIIVIFGANFWVFQEEKFSWFDFVTNYCLVPIMILLYLGFKFKNKTKIVPLDKCNFEYDYTK